MSIEEAEDILNEAVISEPSIKSYTYISAEEINTAINRILEECMNERVKIKELEVEIEQERNKLEKIIKEKNNEKERNTPQIIKNIYIIRIFKYFKKVVKPLFLLEN